MWNAPLIQVIVSHVMRVSLPGSDVRAEFRLQAAPVAPDSAAEGSVNARLRTVVSGSHHVYTGAKVLPSSSTMDVPLPVMHASIMRSRRERG